MLAFSALQGKPAAQGGRGGGSAAIMMAFGSDLGLGGMGGGASGGMGGGALGVVALGGGHGWHLTGPPPPPGGTATTKPQQQPPPARGGG